MNIIEILKIFDINGWDICKDESGDQYCEVILDDKILTVIPNFRAYSDYEVLKMNYSLSNVGFKEVASTIFGASHRYPMIAKKDKIKVKSIEKNDIELAIENILSWGKCQKIEEILNAFRLNCPDAPGQSQLYHLSALAVAGDVDKLECYDKYLSNGNRLNLVPMITQEMLKRAIDISKSFG